MRRTAGRLSDGREIIWFDADGAPERTAVDRRGLSATATASQLRYDALLDEWVAVAAHRQGRTHLPRADRCPLCPTRGEHLSEVPTDGYDVVVFENRFPSFAPHAAGLPEPPSHDALFATRPGVGRCEVVVFSDRHDDSFASLTPGRARLVVEAWADRTAALSALPGVAHVFPFENRGEEIGVTLHHPHGQVYGYPVVPPRVRRMLEVARRHRDRTGRGLVADLLAAERADGSRVVVAGEHWTAFVPAAARWPVEVHLVAHRRVPDLPALDGAERDELAVVLLDVLHRLDALYDAPLPYIAAWHQAPVAADRDLAHLHLQVFSIRRAPGKLKYLAGSESGMGVFVNDVLPEDMAQRLREAVPGVPA